MTLKPAADDAAAAGLVLGLGAYLMWGLLPAFLKTLGHVPPVEVLAHRVLWSALLLAVVVTALRRWPQVRQAFAAPRLLAILFGTAALIGANWLLYIWAVNSGQVLETSLGYFINPLLNVALGMLVLGERLGRVQLAAVLLALAGVLYLTIMQGALPWIALALAASFGLYGLLRKLAPVDALTGLLVETLLLAPVALLFVGQAQATGTGSFGGDASTSLLLMSAGAVTAVPLLMFAGAAKRLRFATLGLLQYVAPTMQFLLAVLVYKEPLTSAHLVAFALIWSGLALFAADALAAERGRRLARA